MQMYVIILSYKEVVFLLTIVTASLTEWSAYRTTNHEFAGSIPAVLPWKFF